MDISSTKSTTSPSTVAIRPRSHLSPSLHGSDFHGVLRTKFFFAHQEFAKFKERSSGTTISWDFYAFLVGSRDDAFVDSIDEDCPLYQTLHLSNSNLHPFAFTVVLLQLCRRYRNLHQKAGVVRSSPNALSHVLRCDHHHLMIHSCGSSHSLPHGSRLFPPRWRQFSPSLSGYTSRFPISRR